MVAPPQSRQIRQKKPCKPQKDKKAKDIRRGREEDGRGDCRINFEIFEDQRDQESEKACDDHIASHCGHDDEAEEKVVVSDVKNDAGDESGGQPLDEAEGNLFHHEAPVLLEGDFSQGNAANDNGQGLGSGVSAHACDNRHSSGEGDHLKDDILEETHGEGGHEGGDEVDEQPWEAAPDREAQGAVDSFVAADAGEHQEVFAVFFDDDVNDIVGCDDSEDGVLVVDDRDGLEVVFGNEEGYFLLVGLRVDGDQVLICDRVEARAFRRGQDVAQVGGANELVGFVEDEQGLNDFSLGPYGFDFVQGFADRKAAFERDVLRGHDAAGGFRAVAHELMDVLEVAGFHQAQQLFPKVNG